MTEKKIRIAVLALQGAFLEHRQMLDQLGVESFEIRQKSDWDLPKDGLIIPGGESTVMLKLLKELDLFDQVKADIQNGLPVFGTCAGMIVLAGDVSNDDRTRLSTMDIKVMRNGYGRQLGSFRVVHKMEGIDHDIPMTFIRAPYIETVGEGVEILAEVEGRIVAAQQGKQLVTSFHPELDDDLSIHSYFVDKLCR
jgi:5'-phosphate synthase pdxT subunit